ncbi:MAG: GntR family transcriptional regulator [Actinomycetes bacterium]
MAEPTADSSTLGLPSFRSRQNLREEVEHALRAALVSGELKPGSIYSAPLLAAQFGVSATPVREAMLDLAKQGHVQVVRNKGFRVTELSERDLDEVTHLRALIEVPTIRDIARSASQDEVEALRPLAGEIEKSAARGDLATYLDADRRFHLTLLGLAGNQRLVDVVGNLRSQTRLYGLPELASSGALVASGREHVELLDLLLERDARAAERLMRRHIGHIRGAWAGRPEEG